MSLKRIAYNESGITYTLEAIIGVLLIIGTILYLTGNMPYTAQKTGEHSKVQLMNIGRDTMDLIFITPVYEYETWNYSVNRTYYLEADKDFMQPNETVNFTVTYANGTPVNNWLTLQSMTLGTGDPFKNMTKIYNTANWSWSDSPENLSEFSIRAIDSAGRVSNTITIKVGWYFLDSNTGGISGNDNVTGVVYYPNLTHAPNLSISLIGPLVPNNVCLLIPPQAITDATGYFSFGWPSNIKTGGLYYIIATDSSGHSSNKHLIVYSSSGGGATLWVYGQTLPYPGSNQTITIMELSSAYLYLTDKNGYKKITSIKNNWYVNNVEYNPDIPDSKFSLSLNNDNITFTAFLAGDYYIYQQDGTPACPPAVGPVKTNGVLIHVDPIEPPHGTAEDTCVNATELNTYLLRYMPAYVNYNLYLIAPNGSRSTRCPDFQGGKLINGYPTAEALTVNKLAHIQYEGVIPNIDNILELRMVLWYK